MEIISGLTNVRRKPRVLALGNFDGVHRGHQQLLGQTVQLAKEHNLVGAALVFDPHPQ